MPAQSESRDEIVGRRHHGCLGWRLELGRDADTLADVERQVAIDEISPDADDDRQCCILPFRVERDQDLLAPPFEQCRPTPKVVVTSTPPLGLSRQRRTENGAFHSGSRTPSPRYWPRKAS